MSSRICNFRQRTHFLSFFTGVHFASGLSRPLHTFPTLLPSITCTRCIQRSINQSINWSINVGWLVGWLGAGKSNYLLPPSGPEKLCAGGPSMTNGAVLYLPPKACIYPNPTKSCSFTFRTWGKRARMSETGIIPRRDGDGKKLRKKISRQDDIHIPCVFSQEEFSGKMQENPSPTVEKQS